jgi:hypothetical protein
MKSKLKQILLIMLLTLCLSIPAFAGEQELTFGWDFRTVQANFAGWYIYYSDVSMADCKVDNQGSITIPYIPGMTEFTTTQIFTSPDGQEKEWFFSIVGFDTSDNESGCSNEVSVVIDLESPPTETNFSVTVTIN